MDVTISLLQGSNTIKLISSTDDGLPNLDQIGYISSGLSKGSCLVTGIGSENTASSISIFPNPSKGFFQVSSSHATDVQLFDLKGQLLEQHQQVQSVELGLHLPIGLYFIQVGDRMYRS